MERGGDCDDGDREPVSTVNHNSVDATSAQVFYSWCMHEVHLRMGKTSFSPLDSWGSHIKQTFVRFIFFRSFLLLLTWEGRVDIPYTNEGHGLH